MPQQSEVQAQSVQTQPEGPQTGLPKSMLLWAGLGVLLVGFMIFGLIRLFITIQSYNAANSGSVTWTYVFRSERAQTYTGEAGATPFGFSITTIQLKVKNTKSQNVALSGNDFTISDDSRNIHPNDIQFDGGGEADSIPANKTTTIDVLFMRHSDKGGFPLSIHNEFDNSTVSITIP